MQTKLILGAILALLLAVTGVSLAFAGDDENGNDNGNNNGERVGAGGYECVTLLFRAGPDPGGQPAALTDQCVATLSLAQGQITGQGLVWPRSRFLPQS